MSKSKSAQERAAGLRMPFRLKTGTLVVLEGLDGTGKSTQQERFERACYAPTTGTKMFDGKPLFTHMPSGTNDLGAQIYELTESDEPLDPLARQLLHLACHATEIPGTILPALEAGESVFLDRFWWSTVAYGWSGVRGRLTRSQLATLAQRVWSPVKAPDLICVFMHPHVEDRHNTAQVIRGYQWLLDQGFPNVVQVPPGMESEQTLFILTEMQSRGLYGNGAGDDA